MANERQADLAIVGSGIAGLAAALSAARRGADVALVTAGPLVAGSSMQAQGGIAAALAADDGPALHAADTLAVGGGLNDSRAVRVLVRQGPGRVRELLEARVPFDGQPGLPDLGLEAGHSRRRVLHAGGSATGQVLTSEMARLAREHPCITLHLHHPVSGLLVGGGRVRGVMSGQRAIPARAVVLATGGYSALWGRTTNPAESIGAGMELAWRAGASLADLEFVQFHPTALCLPGQPAYLLTEALRGEGALVVDEAEQPVADPLLPRDQLAIAIARHLKSGGSVFLSLRHLDPEWARERFPNLAVALRRLGLDLARDLLPISPAAHYCMGGVRTDVWGRTDVPGLFAAGEVACTGVQGANRLASNSLLECLVFGDRAARAALRDPDGSVEWATTEIPEGEELPPGSDGPPWPSAAELGECLDRAVGVERDGEELSRAVEWLPCPEAGDLPTPLRLAALVARAALLRRESRGAHFRSDASDSSDRWLGRIHWRRGSAPRFEEVTR